jgi:citrate lyase subunit beta/citryl-CoA lyase
MEYKLPPWRSLLFVPANVPEYIDKAHQRGADAIVLDLEDSIPQGEKAAARERVASAAEQLSARGVDVVVRVNASLRLVAPDLEAVASPAVRAVCVPKVNGAAQLQWISEALGELEIERGIPQGTIRLIAMIESVGALSRREEIATSTRRLAAMTLGTEDFAASAGIAPEADALLYPCQQVVFAARAAGITPLGFVGSIAQYRDLEAFRTTIRRSRQLGFRGALCIHPAQVAIMNEGFAPSQEELAEARGIIDAYERALAAGRGSAEYNGRMLDAPVVARAKEVLASAVDEVPQGAPATD